jgi:hypothetical protein
LLDWDSESVIILVYYLSDIALSCYLHGNKWRFYADNLIIR